MLLKNILIERQENELILNVSLFENETTVCYYLGH